MVQKRGVMAYFDQSFFNEYDRLKKISDDKLQKWEAAAKNIHSHEQYLASIHLYDEANEAHKDWHKFLDKNWKKAFFKSD